MPCARFGFGRIARGERTAALDSNWVYQYIGIFMSNMNMNMEHDLVLYLYE